MIKLIEFKNQNVKLIEFKPLINRLWHINNDWNKYFDSIKSNNDMLSDKLLNSDKKSIIDIDLI